MTDRAKVEAVMAKMEEGESLRAACRLHNVPPTNFLRAVDKDTTLQEQYARARARLLDVQAEELEDIGERAANAETAVEVAGLKLLSDNRKWLLSKLAPRKYGDKVQQEVSGPNGGPVQVTQIQLIPMHDSRTDRDPE